MITYILTFIAIPIYNKIFKSKQAFIAAISLHLFLLLALRSDDLGVDIDNYKKYYYAWKNLSFQNYYMD